VKSTGVVRRIDELGRIVIPKEIRRNLGIRDGESLEILVAENCIQLKKISKVLEFSDLATRLCDNTKNTMYLNIIITDRDRVIAEGLHDENTVGESILPEVLIQYIQNRETYLSKDLETKKYFGQEIEGYFLVQPIITSIDCIGLVIFHKKKSFTVEEVNFAKFLANILINKIDI